MSLLKSVVAGIPPLQILCQLEVPVPDSSSRCFRRRGEFAASTAKYILSDQGYASIYSSDSAEESEKERTSKGKLGKLARRRFEAMLRVLSGKRSEIARAMEFAMTHAEATDEVRIPKLEPRAKVAGCRDSLSKP
jgi:hypothetical protein